MTTESDLPEVVAEHLDRSSPSWTVTHEPTAEAAEQALSSGQFDAAVVDAASGDAADHLLTVLREMQPDCLRLVLADPVTLDGATELLTTCHRVLVRPCDPFAMQMAIEHAIRLRDTLGRSGVRALGLRRRNRDSRRPTGDLLSTV